MGEIIEVRLSDVQHRQLVEEARAAGQKFFDYCRAKLVASPVSIAATAAPADEPKRTIVKPVTMQVFDFTPADPQAQRLDRLEGLMERVLEHLSAAPAPMEQDENHPRAMAGQVDFESIMAQRLADADAQGLTRPQAAAEVELTQDEEDYKLVGVRPFRKAPAPSFSSHGTSPRITREGTSTYRV